MEAVNLKIITDELSKFSGMVKEEEIQGLADEIKKANKIFLAGAGRFVALCFHYRFIIQ